MAEYFCSLIASISYTNNNSIGFYQLATRAQALAIKAIGATLDYIKNIT
jgi:hypothetical protein